MRISYKVAGIVAAAAMVVVGCSGGSGSDSVDSGEAPESSQLINGEYPADGPPQDGGILVVNDSSDPPMLDPHKQSSAFTHSAVSGIVYSKLLEFVTGRDVEYGSMGVRGDLAETWESSADGTEWTFHLRQGVKWQNVAPVNGREFTAADVVCTVDRIKTLPGVQANLVEVVDQVQTPDPHTAVFKLKMPFAAFDENVANFFMEIIPCEGARGQFDMTSQAIGTGPFILTQWDRGQSRMYVKNPDYFIPGKPHLDGIEIVVLNDPAAAIAAFRTGQLDVTGSITDTLAPSVVSTTPDAIIQAQLNLSSTQVTFNENVKPFDDLRVRKAIGMAWDRVGLASNFYTESFAIEGPFPSTLFGGMPSSEAQEKLPYDPDAAKALLAEAGYPNGFDVEILTTNGYGPQVTNGAQWVQEDLKKIGINATLKVLDYTTYFTTFGKKDYTMTYGISTGFLSADEWLNAIYRSDGPRNWFNSGSPELDAKIAEQRTILDESEREAYLADLNNHIYENVLNPILGFQTGNYLAAQPYVHNLWNHPSYARGYMVDVWLDSNAPKR